VLLLLHYGPDKALLGTHFPALFETTLFLYLGLTLASATLDNRRHQRAFPAWAQPAALISDLGMLTLVVHSNGGLEGGLAVLLLVTVAAGNILLRGRQGFLIAALATLSAMFEQFYFSIHAQLSSPFALTESGLLGIAFFMVSLIIQQIAQRLEQTERITKQQRDNISATTRGLLIYQEDENPGFYYYDGTAWVTFNGAHELNDLDDVTVVWDNQGASYFIGQNGPDTTNYGGVLNISFGDQAFQQLTSGTHNTAIGSSSLSILTTGSNNVVLGEKSGNTIISGGDNIMIGNEVNPSSDSASNELNIGSTIFATEIYGTTSKVGIRTNAPNSTLDVAGSVSMKYNHGPEDYTLLETDYVYNITGPTSNESVRLPKATESMTGRIYIVKSSVGGATHLEAYEDQKIDGNKKVTLPGKGCFHVQCTGTGWIIIAKY